MTSPSQHSDVTVYWRPGCGFCTALLSRLAGSDLAYETVNIWEDEHAAAYVRSVARGNETVPTVRIGDVALVNPSYRQLVEAATGEQTRRRFFR